MQRIRTLLNLLFTFMKIGLFTFGGGYAMISLIESECVEKKKWIEENELADILVIAESTPGPIAINCATFVGYKQNKFLGALFATIGVVLPSFVIIFVISLFLNRFLEIKLVAYAFNGIKVAVGILILRAAIGMLVKMKKKPVTIAVLIISCTLMMLIDIFAWNFSSIYLILIAGVIGLVLFKLEEGVKKREEKDK